MAFRRTEPWSQKVAAIRDRPDERTRRIEPWIRPFLRQIRLGSGSVPRLPRSTGVPRWSLATQDFLANPGCPVSSLVRDRTAWSRMELSEFPVRSNLVWDEPRASRHKSCDALCDASYN